MKKLSPEKKKEHTRASSLKYSQTHREEIRAKQFKAKLKKWEDAGFE